MRQNKKNDVAYAELINRCWKDSAYLAKFKEDPAAALRDFGIPTVAGARYHVVAPDEVKPNTAEDIYLPYQEKPGLKKLGDDMLDGTAGGASFAIIKSNVVVNQNAVADGTVVGESVAVAVTIAVEVAVG